MKEQNPPESSFARRMRMLAGTMFLLLPVMYCVLLTCAELSTPPSEEPNPEQPPAVAVWLYTFVLYAGIMMPLYLPPAAAGLRLLSRPAGRAAALCSAVSLLTFGGLSWLAGQVFFYANTPLLRALLPASWIPLTGPALAVLLATLLALVRLRETLFAFWLPLIALAAAFRLLF